MASTAAAYPNSGAYESEKSSSLFSLISQVRASTLAERHRNLIVAMLHKNRFGTELWMSTESISVMMGRVCYRRKPGGWSAHQKPRQLHNCDRISRRAVQRLIDEVVALGVLTQVHGDNEMVPYGGGKKFRHTATYRLNPDKLAPRQTHDEYVEQRDRARAKGRKAHREESQREHAHEAEVTPIRKPAQPAPEPLPPAPAAPLPKRERPAAETGHKLRLKGDRTEREMRRDVVNRVSELMKPRTIMGETVSRKHSLQVSPGAAGQLPEKSDSWALISERLRKRLDRHTHDTWIHPLRFRQAMGRVLTVSVPRVEFVHAADKYAGPIQEAVTDLKLPCEEIIFMWHESASTAAALSKADAVRKACEELGIPLEEALRVTGWDVGESVKEQGS